MRKLCILFSVLIILTSSVAKAQRVGINGDGSTPDTSAMLDVKSTTKGLLIPRVALSATNSASPVTLPATGLLVYNNVATKGDYPVTPGFYYWNGSSWEKLSTNAWSLNGNANTDATANFIGTTDDQNLVFGVHSIPSGFINKTHGNTALGFSGLSPNISGTSNTAIGSTSLFNNTLGSDNTANGSNALFNNVTGSFNTALGSRTLYSNTGSENTATGNTAMYGNTTGSYNTAIGSQTLLGNATGSYNTAVGYLANVTNGSLTNATAIGYNAQVSQSNALVLGNNVNVGIGTSSPDASSLLDLSSTSKGILIPRMSTSDRNAIPSPSAGLMVYDITLNSFYYFNGTAWTEVGGSAAANAWSLSGNGGTDPATNFIGTTDDQPLIFKAHNSLAGQVHSSLLDNVNTNVSFGLGALNSNVFDAGNPSLGNFNVAIGNEALFYNTTGSRNVAVGYGALLNNVLNGNTAVGYSALMANSLGDGNTAVGAEALKSNGGGAANTATGYNALYSNRSGNANTAIGLGAMFANTSGEENTAIGSDAMISNTTGSGSTAIGCHTLVANTASEITAVGANALFNNTTGTANSSLGFKSLYNNSTGSNSVALGHQSLMSNQTGNDNTAVGSSSLQANVDGHRNTAVGSNSLLVNTQSDNTAVGFNALKSNTTGLGNTAYGSVALAGNVNGQFNTAVGAGSLVSSNAQLNVAVGYSALHENTDGGQNTAIGSNALLTNTTGNGNTALGLNADVSAENLNNATAIGAGAIVDASNKVRIGNNSVTVVESAGTFSTVSDGRFKFNVREDVKGLDFILKLRPVTYQFDAKRLNDYTRGVKFGTDVVQASYNETTFQRRTGFIAQEVEQAANQSGFDFSGINKPKSATDHYSLSYESFVVPLVKAVQEQQTIIEKQNDEVRKLKEQVEVLTKAVEKISSNK
jgi:trimeric autotransporter adhesin